MGSAKISIRLIARNAPIKERGLWLMEYEELIA